MRNSRFLLILALFCGTLSGAQLYASTSKQLPPHYRQWIDENVPYIITQDERREFLRLQTDDERDRFIEEFWESRNPTPHSSINIFKEEHYRRLAYVRAEFGDERYNDGWRTDMGRIYITLGPPQQTTKLHQGMSTRPVEIWFYQSPSPALPAYFNLVFYKRSEADPYTLYSPRDDGPTKIVTNDLHDDAQALRTIDKSMGSEATHAMVSLLPGEPINVDHPSPTMQSDLLLDEIRNLPEQKLEKARILRQRSATHETVTANIFTGFDTMELQSVTLRDRQGLSTVYYLVRRQQPDPSLIGLLADKRTGYDLTLKTRVIAESGKAIYETSDQLTGETSPAGAKAGREKIFAAEGRLPLVPGSYSVESVVTNNINHTSSHAATKIIVPLPQTQNIALSGLMVYRGRPLENSKTQIPFTVAGLRFAPRAEQTVELHAGENLPLVYQLWLPSQDLPPTAEAKIGKANLIHVHYTLGAVALSTSDIGRIEEDQDLSVIDADQAGNLVAGHTLDTTKLSIGTYRLVVRVTDPASTRAAYATLAIKIVPEQSPVDLWTAYGDETRHPIWQDDFLRGIASESLGNAEEAATYYRRALTAKPDASDIANRLNGLNIKIAQHASGSK